MFHHAPTAQKATEAKGSHQHHRPSGRLWHSLSRRTGDEIVFPALLFRRNEIIVFIGPEIREQGLDHFGQTGNQRWAGIDPRSVAAIDAPLFSLGRAVGREAGGIFLHFAAKKICLLPAG